MLNQSADGFFFLKWNFLKKNDLLSFKMNWPVRSSKTDTCYTRSSLTHCLFETQPSVAVKVSKSKNKIETKMIKLQLIDGYAFLKNI